MSERVGILGGTFNPPHLAHLICAQEAKLRLGLDRVLMIPNGHPPHKADDPEDPGAQHRLALCEAAAAGDETIQTSAIEVEREGPSYTVDTLKALHNEMPDSELYLIVGADVAAGLPNWHDPEGVLALATLAIAERRGTSPVAVESALDALGGGERAVHFEMPWIDVSSTEIRRRVRAGEPIRYLVPEPVADYIDKHRLYGGPSHP